LNGLAGMHILSMDLPMAVELYRTVIRSADEHADRLHISPFQLLHAYHNLHWVLSNEGKNEIITAENLPPGVPPTLDDDKLQEKAQDIRNKYLATKLAVIESAREFYKESKDGVKKTGSDVEKMDGGKLSPAELHAAVRDKGNATGSVKNPTTSYLYESDDEGEENLIGKSPWWLDVLGRFLASPNVENATELVMLKVREELDQGQNMTSSSMKFEDLRGLRLSIYQKLCQIEEARKTVVEGVESLNKRFPPSAELINKVVDCHLRPGGHVRGRRKNNCEFCLLEKQLEHYETRLFAMARIDVVERSRRLINSTYLAIEEEKRDAGMQGSWADSEVEKSLKALLFLAKNSFGMMMEERGNLHLQLFAAWKKEFKSLRGLWMSLGQHVAGLDELEQAIQRYRLPLPGENPYSFLGAENIVDKTEIRVRMRRLENERTLCERDMKKKLGTLLYLKNLDPNQALVEQSSQTSVADDESVEDGPSKSDTEVRMVNPEPCSICLNALGSEWSVLRCGHCFCLICVRTLLEHQSGSSGGGRASQDPILKSNPKIPCALCRELTAYEDVSYVSTRQRREEKEMIKVRGSHSTKVEAVVRKIITILAEDEESRILIFSTWNEVLGLVSNALTDNDVANLSLSRSQMAKTKVLEAFRSKKNRSRVLLLNLSSGANGLNLTEANHVILVDPIMNLAAEYQAIGRIHRIGQTRPTFVHRFIVRGTVEEKLHKMLTAVQQRQRPSDPDGPSTSAAALATGGDDDEETAGMTVADLCVLLDTGAEDARRLAQEAADAAQAAEEARRIAALAAAMSDEEEDELF